MPAEEETIRELAQIGKPYVVLLNSLHPYNQETQQAAKELENKYRCAVIPVNCEQLKKEDIYHILKKLLYEFPVSRVTYAIPKWVEMLPMDSELKQSIMEYARDILSQLHQVKNAYKLTFDEEQEYVSNARLEGVDLSDGTVHIGISVDDRYYYDNISKLTGVDIGGEYQLIAMIQELSALCKSYESVAKAMDSVNSKGYGVVTPTLNEITMEEPVLIRHGNKFGVKMKALSPSIHMIRANIETEIAPIVGSEEQANDLITYIKDGQKTKEGVFETNIFGKSVGELMEDGMRSKIAMMDDECQMKLQDTMQKIVNDSNGGMVCIII